MRMVESRLGLSFNPRSREGSDCLTESLPTEQPSFNPRSREGSDQPIQIPIPSSAVSIHAPVKGATQYPSDVRVVYCGFNPRSREGSDK